MRGRKRAFALKLDMSMAYDKIEWNFLKSALQRFGFNQIVMDLIMESVTSTTMLILINVAPEGFIRPNRGIRQGCPLSPYLFIICAEVFLQLVAKMKLRSQFKGLRINRYTPSISHLMFADDLLVFVDLIVMPSINSKKC